MTIAKENLATLGDKRYPRKWREAISIMHNSQIVALIGKRLDAVVENTVFRDESDRVVSDKSDGMDINYLRDLYCFQDSEQCLVWLESVGINDKMWVNIPDLPSPKLPKSLRPWLDEQWLQQKGTRQLLIGE